MAAGQAVTGPPPYEKAPNTKLTKRKLSEVKAGTAGFFKAPAIPTTRPYLQDTYSMSRKKPSVPTVRTSVTMPFTWYDLAKDAAELAGLDYTAWARERLLSAAMQELGRERLGRRAAP